MIEATHLPEIVYLVRALTIGLGSFVLALSVYAAVVYLRLPASVAPQRGHVLLLSTATILLSGGVIVNHLMFEIRDEAFHGGSLVFPVAFLLMGRGMLMMLRVVAKRKTEE